MRAMSVSPEPFNRFANDNWRSREPRTRWPALIAVAGLHLLALYAVMQLDGVREKVAEAAPIFVSFMTPAATPAVPPPPQPAPEKPKPVPRLIAHETPAPATVQAPEVTPPKPAAAPAQAAPPATASASEAVIPPNFVAAYLDNPAPDYPSISRNLGEHGRVMLRVYVNTEGEGAEIEIDRSSGYERLDRAAVDAVHRWRFIPAKQGSQAIAAWVLIPINFNLSQ